jgi:hypothetical protein
MKGVKRKGKDPGINCDNHTRKLSSNLFPQINSATKDFHQASWWKVVTMQASNTETHIRSIHDHITRYGVIIVLW